MIQGCKDHLSLRRLSALTAGGFAASMLFVAGLAAEELPSQVAWTAYDVGSAGYNQAVAMGGALKNNMNVDLRVLPGRNDVARQVPLRDGRVQFSATGVGASYLAQEGVQEFGAPEWGPQKVRVLLSSNADSNLSVGVAADLGIETFADLEGKRVAWVVGSPSLNENVTALLAFANLTWDDVERVEFPGFGAAWEGIINDQVDAAFATTTSGQAYQLEASPRGLYWPPVPHDDEEGWARLTANAPFFVPNMATAGATLSEENPHEGAAYPYPVLIAYDTQDSDLVYAMTKALVDLFPEYDGASPGINGWALDRQIFDWVVPYHEGAIRYFEEIGVWNEEFQAHNDALIERQEVLAAAWEEMSEEDIDDEEAFLEAWMAKRAEALEAAGMDPVYR